MTEIKDRNIKKKEIKMKTMLEIDNKKWKMSKRTDVPTMI